MGQAVLFIVGVFSFGHFVVIQIMYQDWLWLVLGFLFAPVVAVLWPFVAWWFGLLPGTLMLIAYLLMGAGVAIGVREQQRVM